MLEDDILPDDVDSIRKEIEMYKGKCDYDTRKKKVVYHSSKDAMDAYMNLQAQHMEKHKWIESEKAHHDLGEAALLDWSRKYAAEFSKFWKRTHERIPV